MLKPFDAVFSAFGRRVVLQNLHSEIWWKVLLTIVGLIFSIGFSSGKKCEYINVISSNMSKSNRKNWSLNTKNIYSLRERFKDIDSRIVRDGTLSEKQKERMN
jgi:hypothetical protein